MRKIKNKKVRTALFIALAVVILAAAGGGYYVLRVKYISDIGIKLTPSRDYPASNVTYYLQSDPAWASEKIGRSNDSLGSAGCLVACAASAITGLGIPMTPSELNKKLTAADGYAGSDLIWYKIHEAVPDVTYSYERIFTEKNIEADLKQGLLPIVSVKYLGNGGSHWVMIIGAKDGDFLIYDPLNDNKTPIPLSTHGKVFSYRVLKKA